MARPGTGWAGSTPSAKPSGHPWIISHNGAGGSVGWADLDLKLGVQICHNLLFGSPKECVELLRGLGPHADVQLHPLVGGLDPEVGWESLRLFQAEVTPQLSEENMA
jgi:hypothetical protein